MTLVSLLRASSCLQAALTVADAALFPSDQLAAPQQGLRANACRHARFISAHYYALARSAAAVHGVATLSRCLGFTLFAPRAPVILDGRARGASTLDRAQPNIDTLRFLIKNTFMLG